MEKMSNYNSNYNLVFRKDNEAIFWKSWRDLAYELKAGPRYSELAIKRFFIVAEGKKILNGDLSFVLFESGQPVAAAFMPIEKMKNEKAVSFSGDFVPAPLFKERVAKRLFSVIDEVARENSISKIMFLIDPFESLNSFNYLEKYGFFGVSILTYFLELSASGDLLRACRKGHICDIKKISGDKRFRTAIYDKDNPSEKAHEEYRDLHRKCSGCETRPEESFDNQFEGLKKGEAILVALEFEGQPAACAYFEILNKKAIYASGADDPSLTKFPLYHTLIFSAMNDLRKRGVKLIELSQPACPSAQFGYYPDEKQLNIAAFKRGFSGRLADFHRGVKYFSKEAFAADLEDFGKNYSRYVENVKEK